MSKPNNPAELPEPRPGEEEPLSGRFAYDGLERIIHEKARLGIMTSLVSHPDGLVFSDLKDLCSLTDGNLSRHLLALHEEGLVEPAKSTGRKRTQTVYRLTPEGRRRFLDYIAVLESVIADALKASAVQPAPERAASRSGPTPRTA